MITLDAQSAAEIAHSYDVAAEYVPASRRHKPTAEQIAVRNELASIGNLDEYDSTQMVMHRLALIDQRIAAGVSAEQIAIDITLTSIIGLTLEESEFVQSRAKKNGVAVREAARNFYYYSDYPQLKADMEAAR
jgi:hypothetical protein